MELTPRWQVKRALSFLLMKRREETQLTLLSFSFLLIWRLISSLLLNKDDCVKESLDIKRLIYALC